LRLLFRVPVPKWYAVEYGRGFIESFNSTFNAKSEADTDREMYKLLAQNKIMLMQAVLMGIQLHLGEKVQLTLLRGKQPQSEADEALLQYLAEAEQCSGIKIEKLEDITTFRNELERKIDKYAELYPEKEVKQSGVSIMQLCYSVESLMNVRIDYDKMTLSEFAELKQMADQRAKQMQDQINKQNG